MQVCMWVNLHFSWQKDSVYPEECLSPVAMGNGREPDLREKEKRKAFLPQSKPVTVDVIVVLRNQLRVTDSFLKLLSHSGGRSQAHDYVKRVVLIPTPVIKLNIEIMQPFLGGG